MEPHARTVHAHPAADATRTGTLGDWRRRVRGGSLGCVGLAVLAPIVRCASGSMDEDGRRAELQRLAGHLGRHACG